MSERIDLNCDLGEWRTAEGPQRDEAIMPYISSCNIACGGHIGDEQSMKATIKLAKKNGVAIGAHPSYPDREHFGREIPDITKDELRASLEKQIKDLKRYLDEFGEPLHHVKPHGALYNHAARDEDVSRLLMEIIQKCAPDTPVYLPPGSVSQNIARKFGIRVISEVFADRAYEDDLSLRSRKLDGAVLHENEKVLDQLKLMIMEKKVNTYSGKLLSIYPETVCLHSDTPGATELARSIHQFLKDHGVEIIAP